MRPPAPLTRQWVTEKNSFPIRGMAIYRWPDGNWNCNFELLRISREQISKLPVEQAALELAVSGLYKAFKLGNVAGSESVGEVVVVQTTRGTMIEVPAVIFELAKFMIPRTVKLIEEGGGALPIGFLVTTQKMLLKAQTGSSRGTNVGLMPALAPRAERVVMRKEFEDRNDKQRAKNALNRRKMLVKFWFKNKEGFFRRGLCYRVDANSFWQFNVPVANMDPVSMNEADSEQLGHLARSVARSAIDTFAASFNEEIGDERLLRFNKRNASIDDALTPDILLAACEKLADRLTSSMKKHRYGIVGLSFVERCLSVAWDPEDTRSLEDYPFPIAPSALPEQLDAQALTILKSIATRNRRPAPGPGPGPGPEQVVTGGVAPVNDLRPDGEIDGDMPTHDVFDEEDDDAIDQRAMALADHDQSAALRRIRDEKGATGRHPKEFTPIKHDIDYAGLPKDVE